MSYFNYADLISSLLDPRPFEPGSTLIYVVAYGPKTKSSKKTLIKMLCFYFQLLAMIFACCLYRSAGKDRYA